VPFPANATPGIIAAKIPSVNARAIIFLHMSYLHTGMANSEDKLTVLLFYSQYFLKIRLVIHLPYGPLFAFRLTQWAWQSSESHLDRIS